MEAARVIITKKNDRVPRNARRTQGGEQLINWIRIVKNNQPDQAANMNNTNTVWDRDVSAGRVILFKGKQIDSFSVRIIINDAFCHLFIGICFLTGESPGEFLTRPPRNDQPAAN